MNTNRRPGTARVLRQILCTIGRHAVTIAFQGESAVPALRAPDTLNPETPVADSKISAPWTE